MSQSKRVNVNYPGYWAHGRTFDGEPMTLQINTSRNATGLTNMWKYRWAVKPTEDPKLVEEGGVMYFDWRIFLAFWGVIAAGAVFAGGYVLLIREYGLIVPAILFVAVALGFSFIISIKRKQS